MVTVARQQSITFSCSDKHFGARNTPILGELIWLSIVQLRPFFTISLSLSLSLDLILVKELSLVRSTIGFGFGRIVAIISSVDSIVVVVASILR
jgi:hypothetical protein